jgi:hypothetical protein
METTLALEVLARRLRLQEKPGCASFEHDHQGSTRAKTQMCGRRLYFHQQKVGIGPSPDCARNAPTEIQSIMRSDLLIRISRASGAGELRAVEKN